MTQNTPCRHKPVDCSPSSPGLKRKKKKIPITTTKQRKKKEKKKEKRQEKTRYEKKPRKCDSRHAGLTNSSGDVFRGEALATPP